MTGKTIRIFFADGEPTGILLAEISDWTGTVAGRAALPGRPAQQEGGEIRRTGVCLLVGADPDDPSRALAYIGQTDNVLERLLSHNRSEAKNSWEPTVVNVTPPTLDCVGTAMTMSP